MPVADRRPHCRSNAALLLISVDHDILATLFDALLRRGLTAVAVMRVPPGSSDPRAQDHTLMPFTACQQHEIAQAHANDSFTLGQCDMGLNLECGWRR